ncbi:hypothetical protein V1478_004449 [Vespula squamosa]|uniref:Uncharacterized protein n=1 Tax=Vespula squamosa TaxID=30214 RepID=A0ABD2BG82_VESSQ
MSRDRTNQSQSKPVDKMETHSGVRRINAAKSRILPSGSDKKSYFCKSYLQEPKCTICECEESLRVGAAKPEIITT